MAPELDEAFRVLINLLDEINRKNFSSILKRIYRELQSNPDEKKVSILRAELRSLLADHPGSITDLYGPGDGDKTQDLIDATDVVKVFARRRIREFIIPPPKIPRK